jgi:hypothetical protein
MTLRFTFRGWADLVYDSPKLALADFEAAIKLDPAFNAIRGRLKLEDLIDALRDWIVAAEGVRVIGS